MTLDIFGSYQISRPEATFNIVQQPGHTRVASPPKTHKSGRILSPIQKPIDPPPFVKMDMVQLGLQEWETKYFKSNPNYICVAQLCHPNLSKVLDGRTLFGQTVQSIQRLTLKLGVGTNITRLPDNDFNGYFPFPELYVRKEGTYRLKFTVKELLPGEGRVTEILGVAYSDKFEVVKPKDFKGMSVSSELTLCFHEQGSKMRIRNKETGQRNGDQAAKRGVDDMDSPGESEQSSIAPALRPSSQPSVAPAVQPLDQSSFTPPVQSSEMLTVALIQPMEMLTVAAPVEPKDMFTVSASVESIDMSAVAHPVQQMDMLPVSDSSYFPFYPQNGPYHPDTSNFFFTPQPIEQTSSTEVLYPTDGFTFDVPNGHIFTNNYFAANGDNFANQNDVPGAHPFDPSLGFY
jgi:hypothetical protein